MHTESCTIGFAQSHTDDLYGNDDIRYRIFAPPLLRARGCARATARAQGAGPGGITISRSASATHKTLVLWMLPCRARCVCLGVCVCVGMLGGVLSVSVHETRAGKQSDNRPISLNYC